MTGHTPPRTRASVGPWWYLLLMVAVLLLATYLRVHALQQWPPGLSHDEAISGLDAARIVRTGRAPAYRVDGRPEPLFPYLEAVTVGLLGPTRFGLRMASVFVGLVGVAAAGRAARHLSPDGDEARRRWLGVVAAGTLAILVGHVSLSRVAYRGILLPVGVLLFLDSFAVAWATGRRSAFGWAGVWLALCLNSYTSGLVTLGVLPLAIAHQAVFKRSLLIRRLRGLLVLVTAFALSMVPLLVVFAIQPALYQRAGDLAAETQAATQTERLKLFGSYLWDTWQSFSVRGDVNPQYNAARAPLLHTPFLYGLFLLGIVGCLLRPRRLTGVLALGLLVAFMLPVAFSGEIPHGLRIAGEFAVIPLLVACGLGLLFWLGDQLQSQARGVATATMVLAVTGILGHGAMRTGQLYFEYWEKDIVYGPTEVNAFSWFFMGPLAAEAEYAAAQNGPVYLPLADINRPSVRYLTLRSHPTVTTFAGRMDSDGGLKLPAGTFVLPLDGPLSASYALLEPEGTVTLLPQLDSASLAKLEGLRRASDILLEDPFGVVAAVPFYFPPDGSDIVLERAVAYAASADFAGQVRLVGWAGPAELPPRPDAGQSIEFTLYMEPGPRQRRDLNVFAQIWTLDGESLGGKDSEINRWVYPNGLWQPGDIVPVTLRFRLADSASELAPGGYRLAVGVNDAWGRRLPVWNENGMPVGEVALAGGLRVPPAAPPDLSGMERVHWQVGSSIALIGYRLERGGQPIDALAPGDEAMLVLAWQSTARPASDYTAFFHLEDAAGNVVAQFDTQPTDGLFPTSTWLPGDVFTSLHPLVVPLNADDGPYRLLAGMYAWPSLERLPVTETASGETPDDRRIPLTTFPRS